MAKVKATVHGAVSIVSAIASKKGATLGISLKVEATVETSIGKGIIIQSENKSLSSRLINKTIEKIVSKKDLEKNKITITLTSEIPTGYGLKSSSAISSVVALACAKIFKPKLTDKQILLAGVDASIETKVSITGAYDDACSCYYGGFNVTDNGKRNRINFEKIPPNLSAVIFIPRNRKRGNLKKLK
ncbi:MAG: shikimate kinase, partial [Nitrosopumilaceae archaeon]|nr:shikimate kinase [Nitrosopumilaceae archaeon]